MIEELTVTQDIDRLVPTFRMRVMDAGNKLGSLLPYDKSSNEIELSFFRGRNFDGRNTFVFDVKRRHVVSSQTYEVEGILKTEGLFSPYRTRAIVGNLKSNLESIATDELKLEDFQIGASLSFVKTVLQPKWNNALLLRYLKERVEGKGGETCYYCFIKNISGVSTLIFKSIDELFLSKVTNKFVVGAQPFQDFYPVSEYKVHDNSQFRAFFAARCANYRYFDYSSGEYKNACSIDLEDYPSLTEFHSVDMDNDTNLSVPHLGRSNDFTEDFSGRVGQSFYNGVTNSIYMWIATWGIENIAQGDIVQVLFSEALARGNLFVYQHSGLWLVKRVVHLLGNSFMSNILLVRNGIDTDIATTFSPATEVRKE
jgi:hypothetical protein